MLEVGKAGSAGADKDALPVLDDGVVVATMRAARWKEAATAVVGDREWVFSKDGRELTGRWAAEPADAVRLRARQTSFWKSTWAADLDGLHVEMRSASVWKGTHRYLVGGTVIAESGTTGGWSPRPTLSTAADLPLPARVFLLWLELVLRRRSNATTAAGGAAAAGAAGVL